ncbi:MAG: hypothetical protein ACK401_06760 [Archaeoglobaceae archaeon]
MGLKELEVHDWLERKLWVEIRPRWDCLSRIDPKIEVWRKIDVLSSF